MRNRGAKNIGLPTKAAAHSSPIPGPNELVSRHDVIVFMADAWLPRLPADTAREARDKVGKQIQTAIKRGKLGAPAKGKFVFGEVIAWAREKKKWRGLFDDLPVVLKPISGGMAATLPRGSLRGEGYAVPDSLPECQAAFVAARKQIRVLEHTLRALRAELKLAREERDGYSVDALRYRQFKNRSGRRGRG